MADVDDGESSQESDGRFVAMRRVCKRLLFPYAKSMFGRSLGWSKGLQTLMLTHTILAKQQGYENLLSVLGDHLKQSDDEHLRFFQTTVEPAYTALVENSPKALFEVLGTPRRPIQNYAQKQAWKSIKRALAEARDKTIADVLEVVSTSHLIDLPPKVSSTLTEFRQGGNPVIRGETKAIELYGIAYSEVINAIGFLNSESGFSTDHGVKGEEYENVLLVLGRGWNNYKFDDVLYKDLMTLSGRERDVYIRNRNLFYVCCSRPKKRLAVLVTVEVQGEFDGYLRRLFGRESIMTYEQFMTPRVPA